MSARSAHSGSATRTIPKVITAGVDLSSHDARTARCVVKWSGGKARVELSLNTSDQQITNLVQSSDKVGIDVPSGWQTAFLAAVAQHGRDGSWPAEYAHSDTRAMRYRRTDLWLHLRLSSRLTLRVPHP
jgi:hypothetical protein